jgi:CheY-like chemotaxis protein
MSTPTSTPTSKPTSTPTSKRKVLVIDDNEDTARLLSLLLEVRGHEARAAFNGEEALAICRDFRPEAIILDLTLPDIEGFELAKRLRAIEGLEDVAIVAATGWSDDELARQARELGFRAFLTKPIDPALLDEALR